MLACKSKSYELEFLAVIKSYKGIYLFLKQVCAT